MDEGNVKNWPDREGHAAAFGAEAPAGVPAGVPPELVAAIRGHPAFPSAMRRSARAIVGAYRRNRLLNRLISDRGRALFGILAIYLHFHEDETGAGLTPSRMAGLCEGLGVCSRGRVKALLLLLRWAGHLAPAEASGDQRRRPLQPTARMTAAYRERWREQLELLAPILPEVKPVAAALDRPEIFARFAVALGSGLRSGFRILDHCPALARVAERDNGLLLMFSLALSGPADGPVPPARATVSIAALAGVARVSRSHVLNVLREAERQGLVAREPASRHADGIVLRCRPLLGDSLAGFFAATYAVMAVAARAVGRPAAP